MITFKKNKRGLSLLFSLLLVVTAQNIHAMSVTPTVVEMAASGKASRANLQVINDSKKPLPIEMVIVRVEVDRNGKVSEQEAGDEFLIFPPQKMIAAGATQNFRVQWLGNPTLQKSQSYRFSVNQIPLKNTNTAEEGKSSVSVSIAFNFGVVVNVRPTQGNAELALLKTEVIKDAKSKTRAVLTVKNNGNIHARLSDSIIRLSSGNWSKKLSPASLSQSLGVGLVQPGKTRRFVLPFEMPTTVNTLNASIDYRFKR